MHVPRFVILSFALALAGLAGLAALAVIRLPPAAAPSPPPAPSAVTIGGPFALTDHTGKRVTDADFRGRYMLVFFGFVSCPDICPTSLYNATLALQQVGARAREVVPIFITVDPARDTPALLKTYLTNYHDSFVGLTGSEAEIAAAARAYKVLYGRGDDDGKGNYTMYHSAYLYLMGPDGKYLAHLRHEDPPARMAETILKHMQR